MTILTRDELLDRLPRVGCVALRPFTVFTEEARWVGVFGVAWHLQGGVELHVDAADVEAVAAEYPDETVPLSRYIAATVRDIYLPPMRVHVRLSDLKYHCQPGERGAGPRASGPLRTCTHPRIDYSCGPCMAAFIRARSALLGMEAPCPTL